MVLHVYKIQEQDTMKEEQTLLKKKNKGINSRNRMKSSLKQKENSNTVTKEQIRLI